MSRPWPRLVKTPMLDSLWSRMLGATRWRTPVSSSFVVRSSQRSLGSESVQVMEAAPETVTI